MITVGDWMPEKRTKNEKFKKSKDTKRRILYNTWPKLRGMIQSIDIQCEHAYCCTHASRQHRWEGKQGKKTFVKREKDRRE